MAIQTINIGTNPNDGTGDDLRTAFDKVNDNFAELLAVGGETNTASNLGIGEGIFKQKNGLDLEFKTLRNSDGKITISSDGNSVYLNTSNLADNDFGIIQVDNGDTITATQSSAIVGIKGGDNITTVKSGNDVLISSAFEIVNDQTPQLGGDLSMLGNDIIGQSSGTGSNLVNIRNIDSVSVDTDTLVVNTSTTVNGTTTFNATITAAGGITLGAGQAISGNVSGGFQGQLTGALDTNGQTISGDGPITIDVGQIVTPFVLGTEFGTSYRTLPEPLLVQTGVDLPSSFVTASTNTNVPQFPLNIEHVVDLTQTGGSSYSTGFGAGIQFTVNDTDSNSLTTGVIVSGPVDSVVNEVQLLPLQTGKAAIAQPQYFRFNSSGVATLNDIEISETGITTNISNKNLTLSANGSGKVDFYGAYQFPNTIGNAGEVLIVPLSGTTLEWGAGGGGGGGSSTFVGLSDTPASYAGGAGDALKFVRVSAGGTALEFITVDNVIDATYIEGKGFLPKSGGTMSGNVDLGTNDITNGGTITATTFSGTHSGDVSGATTVTTTNLNVSTIDTTDSSEITVTPGVKLESYLTVESSLNVLDTTATKTLDVSGNAIINGTLTADNFQLSGGGAPSFTSGSDINFSAVGQLSTDAPLVPTTDNAITLGTASFKWSNVYATTFTGNLTGDVTGDVTGNADTATEITATANNSTNETVYLTFVDGATGVQGIETDTDLNYNPSTNVLTVGSITGNLNATTIDVGNMHIENNSIETTSNGILRLAAQGSGSIELDGNVHVPGKFAFTGGEDRSITGTATPITLSADTYASFITTNDWTGVGAEFAYADLPDGTHDGQMKMVKVVERGQYINTSVGPTPVDRYLVLNLTLNSAGSATFNISENSEYGAATFIWHNSSWWVVSQFDS
jgi:hypothetical protein